MAVKTKKTSYFKGMITSVLPENTGGIVGDLIVCY